MDLQTLNELSDSDLLARVRKLAQAECRAAAALIAHLIEVDNRKLYLGEACSSLFTYCVRVLHYSEPAAYNRIFAARAARAFPVILTHLESGAVHLAAVRLLAPLLTAENCDELLAAAAHKSKRDVEEMVVRIRPQPDVREAVRKLRPPARPVMGQPGLDLPMTEQNKADMPPAPPPAGPQPGVPHAEQDLAAPASPPPPPLQQRAQPPPPQQQQHRPSVVPLAAERFKVQFTATAATRDKLRRAQELLRHRIPDGDISQVIDEALELLLRNLEKKKFAALAPRPVTARRASAAAPSAGPQERTAAARSSRHIPASVRRAVWQRDQGLCAFRGANGERCGERSGLEFDHIRPYADGGGVDLSNIRLLCRQHNQYESRQFFGVWRADLQSVSRRE